MVEVRNKFLGEYFRPKKDISGRINKTIGLDEDVFRMVRENQIENFSRYVNEIIREDLSVYSERDAKRILVGRVEQLRRFAQENGLKMEINLE